jgi:H+/Na+-translocating ferredoxin:NAD+ oxidoreductase subunit B
MDIKSLLFPVITLGGMGVAFGAILGYASKKFEVKVDPKIPQIRDALPGANCGGCGFAGCDAYAEAVANGEAAPNLCGPGGANAAESIAKILGVKVEDSAPKVAFVQCNGTCDKAKEKNKYYGIMDCRQAVIAPGGGSKACEYGCLGLGSCVKACNFDAISIENGVAVVDEKKCVACGACVEACPKNIIHLVPAKSLVRVNCNSKSKGKDVKDNCEVGCIGCTMCARNCPKEAIEMVNNLPVIDYSKCVNCGICATKCPTNAILNLRKKKVSSEAQKEIAANKE